MSTYNDAASRQARSFDLNHQRRRDIARLVVNRPGRMAKAARCIPYAEAAAWHCPFDSDRRFLMVQWCHWTCAPPSVERQIDAILEANPPRRISADALARHLGVSDAERTALRIWTIGSFDVPKAARTKRRKQKRGLAAKAHRQGRGAKPREQSLSHTKPWEAFGIKRRAWEYRGKPDPAIAQIRGQTHCANTRPRSSLPSGYEFAQPAEELPRWGLPPGTDRACSPHGRPPEGAYTPQKPSMQRHCEEAWHDGVGLCIEDANGLRKLKQRDIDCFAGLELTSDRRQ